MVIVMFGFCCKSSYSHLERPQNSIKYRIIVFMGSDLYPGALSENEFWSTPNELDTLDVSGQRIVTFLDSYFTSLKDTLPVQPDEIDIINHQFAFIKLQRGQQLDTIYGDYFLQRFRIKSKNKYYRDKTGVLYTLFHGIMELRDYTGK